MTEAEMQRDLDFERKHEEDLRRILNFRLSAATAAQVQSGQDITAVCWMQT